MIGIINPIALIGKANDAKRKSDLNKLKTTFEEYFNDKEIYAPEEDILLWNKKEGCGKAIDSKYDFSKYVAVLPCDPHGNIYYIETTTKSFRVITNLENKSDKNIPVNWYKPNTYTLKNGLTVDTVNYGVSSPNIKWYEWGMKELDPICDITDCRVEPGCNKVGVGQPCLKGGNCFYADSKDDCNQECSAEEGCVGQ
jgi:hypothetical protein